MVAIPLAYGASVRDVGRFPEFVTQNMFVEKTPSNQANGLALVGRAGLEAFATAGVGPIRAVFQRSGVFNGDVLVVSGSTLYRVTMGAVVTAATGTVPGAGRVRIDCGPNGTVDEARIACGEDGICLFDGTTVSQEDFPDDAGVDDILFLRGFWIAIRRGTQTLYSRVPGDLVWDPITYTAAEYKPDLAIALESLGDTLMVFGATTMEPFALTGNATNPVEPYGGNAQDVGCRSRDAVVSFVDAVFSVGDDCAVYKFTPGKQVISDPGLAERIRKTSASDLRAWGYVQDQQAFYILSLSGETWVYADGVGWAKWKSKDYDYFRGHLGANVSGRVIAADSLPASGQLWRVTPEKLTDNGEEIERIASGYIEVKGGKVACNNVRLNCAVGHAPLTGQGSAPLVGLSISDDGINWDAYMWRSLGPLGKYGTEVRWNGLREMKAPGRHFRFKTTDPTIVRFSDARMNEL